MLRTLPSGMRVFVAEVRRAPVVAFQAWIRVGSGDERGPEAGLSHALEHMLFKGGGTLGVGDVAREVESCGGEINAYTSFDQTVFHLVLPSRHFDRGLDVVESAVLRPSLDADEFEREKQVVLEEIRRGEDDPGSKLGRALFADVFRHHPYGRPVIGTRESVLAFTPELLRDFHARWYTPANITMVVVGDVDEGEALTALERRFGDGPAVPPPARGRTREPHQQEMRAQLLVEPVVEARVELAFPLPEVTHADIPVADVVSIVLGQGESSWLNQQVRLKRGLANQVHTYSYTPLDPGVFLVEASCPPPQLLATVDAVAEQLARMRRDGPGADEVRRAVANILSDRVYERETVEGVARKLGYFDALFDDPAAEEAYYAAIARVTPHDVQRFAREMFTVERLTTAALVPDGDRVTTDELRARLVDRLGEPNALPGDRPDAPRTVRQQLPGGTTVLVRETPGSGVVSLRLGMHGGARVERAANAGVHHLMARVWPRGTRRRTSLRLSQAMDEVSGRCSAFSGRNSFGLSSTFLASGAERGIDLFREVLLEPSFDTDELERMRALTLQAIRNLPDNPVGYGFLFFHRALYRRHPFRRPMAGTEASVGRLTRGMLRSAYRRGLHASNAVIAAVGDFDGAVMTERLCELAQALPDGDRPAVEVPEEVPLTGVRRRTVEIDKEQAHLFIGFPGMRVSDPDRHAMEVIAAILAGQSGRLFLDLRDRQGLAYSVTAWSQEAVDPGYFAVYIGTEKGKLPRARRGIAEHLVRLTEERVPDDEIERAARYLTGTFEIGLQRGGAVATRILFDELYGLGHEASASYAERIFAVDAATIQRVARERLTIGRHVDVALVPR